MKLAPIAGHVSRLTPEAAWAAAWIEAQSLVTQLQVAIARGDIPLRNRQLPLPPQGERLLSCTFCWTAVSAVLHVKLGTHPCFAQAYVYGGQVSAHMVLSSLCNRMCGKLCHSMSAVCSTVH